MRQEKDNYYIMEKTLIEIIRPGIYKNLNSYWAMHYCAILETLNEQKTISHGFQRNYMNYVEPTLENLVSKAGFSFFSAIKNSLQNFGLQTLLCHYLLSSEGKPIFDDIVAKVSELHSFDFMKDTQEYGIFISAKDFRSGEQFINENNPVLLNLAGRSYKDIVDQVSYADLCILLKSTNANWGILGEVEGNNGDDLLSEAFWKRKKGTYYSFGIGVTQKYKKFKSVTTDPIAAPEITGQYLKTEYGWKYIVLMSTENSVIHDFQNAIGTIQTFMTFGPSQRANYDPSLLPVLNLIKASWDKNIVDLISELRSMLISDSLATLGTNPIATKVLPSIST